MPTKLAILGLDTFERHWLEATQQLRASGEIELVGVGHRSGAQARDLAAALAGTSPAPPVFSDLRLLLKEAAPQILLMDRPPNATQDFLLACFAQETAILSLGPPVDTVAEAQALSGALGPRSRLLYIWPRFADSPIAKHCVQADDFLKPIRFASASWLGINHALAKTSPPSDDISVRSLSVLVWDVLATLIQLVGLPTTVYAAMRGTTAAGDSFADLSGAMSLTLRFADDAAASVTVCDRTAHEDGIERRSLYFWGAGGTLRLDSRGYAFHDAEGKLIDAAPTAPAAPPRAEALETLREVIRHYTLPPSPHRGWEHQLEETAAAMEAVVISHRTGQPESPEKFRRLRR